MTNTRNYVYEEITAILKASNNGDFLKEFFDQINLFMVWYNGSTIKLRYK